MSDNTNNSDEFALPDFTTLFGEPKIEDYDHPMHEDVVREKKPVKKTVKKRVIRKKVKTSNSSNNNSDNRGKTRVDSKGRKYYTDKKTGIEYEVLPGSDKEAVKVYKASKGAGLTLEEMMRYTELADDFSGVDLRGAAERFLPHIQVPITKEEREEAKRKLEEEARRARLRDMENPDN